VGLGSAASASDDYRATFRGGWDGPTASLYVAVEIVDDDLVVEGESPASMRQMARFLQRLGWRRREDAEPPSLRDGCAVIVDVGHQEGDSRTVRFGHDGRGQRYVLTSSERDSTRWRAGDVAVRFAGNRPPKRSRARIGGNLSGTGLTKI
ncbi:MAG: hypothetical protein IIB66_09425, partial [Proteobacteria bacterium]|nr:hypothetical protein [Pseudomonadota bacterium]